MIETESDLSQLTSRQRAVLSCLTCGPSKEAIASLMDSVERTTGFDTARLFTSYLIARNSLSKPVKERAAEPKPFWAVVIVAKNSLTREGLTRIIASRKLHIAVTLSRVENLADSVLPRNRPILLVLYSHNQAANTAPQIKRFRQQYPDARIAVVADNHDGEDVLMAFRAGANGYLVQPECTKDFIKGLELVMSGQTLLMSAMLPKIIDGRQCLIRDDERVFLAPNAKLEAPAAFNGSKMPRLSPRERIILDCIVAGNSNKVIARRIGVSEATVKVHVKSILRKMRVENRTQAASWASRPGGFPPQD